MKKYQIIGIILFVLSIASVFIAAYIPQGVGEVSFFGSMGANCYMWISWLFLPIPIAAFIFGLVFRKKVHVMVDIIGGMVVFSILLFFGCVTLINPVDSSGSFIQDAQNTTNIVMPADVKAMSQKSSQGGRIGIAKLLNHNEEETFKSNMSSDYWEDKYPINAKALLPSSITYQTEKEYEKYCLYILPSKTFNPQTIEHGKYDVCYIAYNSNLHKLYIFDNYSVEI